VTNVFEKHILVESSDTLALDYLAEHTGLSKQRIKKVMHNGALWLESSQGISRLRRAKKTLNKGEKVHLYYNENIQSSIPTPATLISDEDTYSIWNKPYGMYSQGSKWGDHCTIYRWAENNLEPQRPAFLVHRLDRAANGLIILAHKKSVAAAFSQMFQNHEITKKYRATVKGILHARTLPLSIETPLDNKSAYTQIIQTDTDTKNHTTTLELYIKTGRKHQIRRHLAETGYPILGDRLYGDKGDEKHDMNLQLSSIYLSFTCPVTNVKKEYALPLT